MQTEVHGPAIVGALLRMRTRLRTRAVHVPVLPIGVRDHDTLTLSISLMKDSRHWQCSYGIPGYQHNTSHIFVSPIQGITQNISCLSMPVRELLFAWIGAPE